MMNTMIVMYVQKEKHLSMQQRTEKDTVNTKVVGWFVRVVHA